MDIVKMVEVIRGGFTESTHRGVAVLINSNGEILQEWGKSLNLYKDGVAKALGLSNNLIALTTASHHAENNHQKMINNWLKKINLKEKHLSCGPSWPWNIKDQFKEGPLGFFLSGNEPGTKTEYGGIFP